MFSLFFAFVLYVYIISVKSIINLLKYSTIQLSVLVEYLGSLTYCINVRSWKLAGTTSISQTKGNINYLRERNTENILIIGHDPVNYEFPTRSKLLPLISFLVCQTGLKSSLH